MRDQLPKLEKVKKAVILLSGGLDSSTLLYYVASMVEEVHALGILYGQKHERELQSAAMVASQKQTPFTLLDLRSDGLSKAFQRSCLLDDSQPVPDGKYDDPSMQSTVVPNRNMLFLAVAGAYALTWGASVVCYGAHAGDHPIYADCRPGFVSGIEKAFGELGLELWTPFLTMEKWEIVSLGKIHKVPFSLTWSCYKGGEIHCGTCGTCVERKEAFDLALENDSTIYLA